MPSHARLVQAAALAFDLAVLKFRGRHAPTNFALLVDCPDEITVLDQVGWQPLACMHTTMQASAIRRQICVEWSLQAAVHMSPSLLLLIRSGRKHAKVAALLPV